MILLLDIFLILGSKLLVLLLTAKDVRAQFGGKNVQSNQGIQSYGNLLSGQAGLPNVETNPNTNEIPVMLFQEDGYASDKSWAYFNGTIKVGVHIFDTVNTEHTHLNQTDLISYTICHRFKYHFDRPRMYLFTYAYDDKNAEELFSGPIQHFKSGNV